MEINELKEILEKKPREVLIDRCVNLDAKTRFFSEISVNLEDTSDYSTSFFGYVDARLNNTESMYKFEKAFTYPINTVDFTNDIHSKIKKIFDGEDPYTSYDISDSIKEDAEQFLNHDWYKNEAFNAYCNTPNSIVIVDVKQIDDEKPEPYPVILPIESILDVKEINGEIKHVIYCITNKLIGVIDEYSYQLFEKDDKDNIFEVPKVDNEHHLGYCPAWFISNKKIKEKYYTRKNHLTQSFGDIQDLTFLKTLKSIISPHAFYHFVVKSKSNSSCGYKQGNIYCANGYLYMSGEEGSDTRVLSKSGNSAEPCPICNKSLGIGNEITTPYTFTDAGAISEPASVVRFIAPDTQILEYSDKFVYAKEESIFSNIVGANEALNPKLNHNESAYKYNSEGQLSVLLNWKTVFEYLIEQIDSTILKLRYGVDSVESVNVNLGTKFILRTEGDLYQEKKDAGALASVIKVDEQIIRKKYANNEEEKQKRLLYLKVYPNMIDVDEKYKSRAIPEKIYIKQVMFEDFINWFEYTYTKPIKIENSVRQNVAILNSAYDIYYKEFFEKEDKVIEVAENQ